MTGAHRNNSLWLQSVIQRSFMVFLVASFAFYIYMKPYYTLDTVAYLECAEFTNGIALESIPSTTESIVQKEVPPNQSAMLMQDKWVTQLLSDSKAVQLYLPVFMSKYGYVLASVLLHKFGLSYLMAFRLINAGSAALLLSALFLWVRQRAGYFQSVAISVLLSLSPFSLDTLKTLRPDPLSTAYAIVGLWLAFERRATFIGLAFLALAALVRPDSVIIFAFAAIALFWLEKDRRRRFLICAASGVSALLYLVAQHMAHAYAWMKLLSIMQFDGKPVTLHLYLSLLSANLIVVISASVSIFLVCAIAVLASARLTIHQSACVYVQLLSLIRYFLFPAPDQRYFMIQNLTMLVLTAVVLLGMNARSVAMLEGESALLSH